MYYYFPEPPYFLVVVGLFIGVTSGLAFEATLKQKVKEWSKQRTLQSLKKIRSFDLLFAFLGICLGVCLFLEAGLEIFLLSPWPSYAIAVPMTIAIGALVWTQLGKVLEQLQAGGSKALDLDDI